MKIVILFLVIVFISCSDEKENLLDDIKQRVEKFYRETSKSQWFIDQMDTRLDKIKKFADYGEQFVTTSDFSSDLETKIFVNWLGNNRAVYLCDF
jgi:hypothetical protein